VYDDIKLPKDLINLFVSSLQTQPLTVIKAAGPDVVYPAAFLNEQTLIVTQGRWDVGLNTIYLSVECNDDPGYSITTINGWTHQKSSQQRLKTHF